MNRIKRVFVWLSRVMYCRGFGIQSPTDYAFVRYVVNEHYPYYAYELFDRLPISSLEKKLGRLYFRLANWYQPSFMERDEYETFWMAGSRKIKMRSSVDHLELGRVSMSGDVKTLLGHIYNKVDRHSVLVIEGIYHNRTLWNEVKNDPRTGITFDLYYCGIVFFDTSRHKRNYIVNF